MTIRSNDVTTRRAASRGGHLRRFGGRAFVAVTLSASVLPALAVLDSSAPAGAQSVTATVNVGTTPKSVAVDATTDTIYVANAADGTVSVIDGSTSSVIGSPIPVGKGPKGIAVDATTDTIYVANGGSDSVSVIDGTTNTVTGSPIPVGTSPKSVAVDATTNTIYVANTGADNVSVIDGASNTVTGTLITTGTNPTAVAVDATTDTVYVTTTAKNKLWAFNGASNAVANKVVVGTSPTAVGVDPSTDTIYVANTGAGSVSVVDGVTHAVVATVPVGTSPKGIGIDGTNGIVYVANAGSGNVSVIDGSTNAVTETVTIGTKTKPFGADVDQSNGTAYVTDAGSADVSVIGSPSATATIVLSADNNPVTVGQDVTYTATVSGSGTTASGSVDFSDGSTPIGSCQNVGLNPVSGSPGAVSATCEQSYSSVTGSPHSISSSYSGDSVYPQTESNVLSETVSPAGTSIQLDVPSSLTYGAEDATPLSATVSTLDGAVPTGSVALVSGGTDVCSITLSGGTGTCSLTAKQLDAATYPLVVTYTPDTGDFTSSSTTGTLTVDPAGTSTVLTVPSALPFGSENATPLSVTVSTLDGAVPKGAVSIVSGTTNVCSIALSGGTGTCTLGVQQLGAGTYPLTATYTPSSGDFNGSSTTGTLVIGQVGTTLVVHKAKSISLTSLQLSATLTTTGGTAVAGETITFSFAGTEFCTATTNAAGLASCDLNPTLVVIILGGSYEGTFAGDQSYGPSSGSGKL